MPVDDHVVPTANTRNLIERRNLAPLYGRPVSAAFDALYTRIFAQSEKWPPARVCIAAHGSIGQLICSRRCWLARTCHGDVSAVPSSPRSDPTLTSRRTPQTAQSVLAWHPNCGLITQSTRFEMTLFRKDLRQHVSQLQQNSERRRRVNWQPSSNPSRMGSVTHSHKDVPRCLLRN
jgi:hypothetical protein